METHERLVRTSISLPEGLWKRFKATAALEGKDMSAIVQRLLEAYTQDALDRLQDRPTASLVTRNGMEPRPPAGATAQD